MTVHLPWSTAVADPALEVRVDPAVHAAQPDYVALVLVAPA